MNYDEYLALSRKFLSDQALSAVIHRFDKRAESVSDEPAESMELMRDVCRAAIAAWVERFFGAKL